MEQMSIEERVRLLEQQVAEYEKKYGALPSGNTSRRTYNSDSRMRLADERAKKFYVLVEQGVPIKEIAQVHGVTQGSVYQSIEGYAERHGLPSLRGTMRDAADERAEKFRSMKLQGVTLEDIGRLSSLSRERVRQIIVKYEKRHNLPSSIPISRKRAKAAKEIDVKEYQEEQRLEKQKQYKRFVPVFQLDADLVGRFLKELGNRAVLYSFDGKAKSNPKARKDGTPYPSSGVPTNIFMSHNRKHLTVHSWVLQQYGIKVEKGQHCHHIDGDITNNMRENLQVLSNVEHGRITMQEQLERGTIDWNIQRRQRKLTDEQVEEIRAAYKPRVTPVPTLAKRYGVAEATIWDVLYGHRAYINVNPATCRVQKNGSKTAMDLRAKQISFNFDTSTP